MALLRTPMVAIHFPLVVEERQAGTSEGGEGMIIIPIIIAVVAVLGIVVCCKVSGKCSREEEQRDPCVTCLRWGECNGVDEDCPWRG